MRNILFTAFVIILSITSLTGQTSSGAWGRLSYLAGSWKGEGNGQPGEGSGYFSFKTDLNEKIIVRKSHSEYPATKDKPLITHDDLMIIYFSNSGSPDKAIYFDNEGHVINYSVTLPNDSDIVFTSAKAGSAPVFRLTYTKEGNNEVNVKFEMSMNGINYRMYVQGKSKRIW